MRILIVDDEADIRFVLKRILQDKGTCNTAENGREALSLFEHCLKDGNLFDIVFLDITMPELDGQEVLKGIRALEAKYGYDIKGRTNVIMTTALSDKKNIFQAFREQCEGYIVKPFEAETVLEQLKKLNLLA